MTPVTAPAPADPRSAAYLKAEPKALGTVQIVIGTMTLLFGIVLSFFDLSPAIVSGIALWGSLIFISSGALSVAAANNYNSCVISWLSSSSLDVKNRKNWFKTLVPEPALELVEEGYLSTIREVKASLGMNVFSAVAAAIAIILFAVDMVYGSVFIPWCLHHYYDHQYRCDFSSLHLWNGIYGVLLVFALLEFIISICTSAFACNVTCCTGTPPMYSHPTHVYTTNVQPTNAQPTNAYPTNAQPTNTQPTNVQPTNVQPMTNAYPTYAPPMYNPAFYDPQDPQQSVVKAYNNL